MTSPALQLGAATAAQPAGRAWDAVRVPRSIGLLALATLGARSGAVIEDDRALYWLVPTGSAAGWDITNTTVLGVGVKVLVPPARRTAGPGPFWRICPGDTWLTDVTALRAAVEDAYRPEAAR
ncbi:hypothetical protein [Streptomyces sp. WAC08241]|uniref:hypothetical protein n=1 Tax=Streptomyces sp. WAC08241 TaxID=2487421 RepID=UPI000F7AF0DA|nr:hypothetical protein [Streptomyces sp. WAC08241]RSS36736.1 hypothetical protein EF906_24590 [Streptomyces sp. WAC08241]